MREDFEIHHYEPYTKDYPLGICFFKKDLTKGMILQSIACGSVGSNMEVIDSRGNCIIKGSLISGMTRISVYLHEDYPPGKWFARISDSKTGQRFKAEAFVKDGWGALAKITLTSNPSGANFFDIGWGYGKTPKTFETPAGCFIGEMGMSGYNEDKFIVDVKPGETMSIHRNLVPKKEYELVVTCPVRARIYMGDEYKGLSPLSITRTPANLVAKLPGYKDYHMIGGVPPVVILAPLTQQEEPPCSTYKTEEQCEVHDCFWYEGACHAAPLSIHDAVARRRVWKPIPPGVNMGNAKSSSWGTISCVVLKDGKKMLLTNNHVLTLGGGIVGTDVWQSNESNRFGKTVQIIPMNPTPAVNDTDIGLVEPYKQDDIVPGIPIPDSTYEPNIIPSGVTEVSKDQLVKKSGARSGFTTGKVKAVNATIEVDYGNEKHCLIKNAIVTDKMGDRGDSGSLGLDQNNKAFGVLFAGGIDHTAFCSISPCLNKLGCTLFTPGAEKITVTFVSVPPGAKISID